MSNGLAVRISGMRLQKRKRAATAQERGFASNEPGSYGCQELDLHLQCGSRTGDMVKEVPHGDVHSGRENSSVKRALGIEQWSGCLELDDAAFLFIADAEAEQTRRKNEPNSCLGSLSARSTNACADDRSIAIALSVTRLPP
jgi:hypothetical protein